MKFILLFFAILFSCSLFSQHQDGIIIAPNKSKNKQYIGISENGRHLFRNTKKPYGTYEIKGHYRDVLITEFADALSDYIGSVTIEEVQQEISDSLGAFISGGFFVGSTATGNTIQDADTTTFTVNELDDFRFATVDDLAGIGTADDETTVFGVTASLSGSGAASMVAPTTTMSSSLANPIIELTTAGTDKIVIGNTTGDTRITGLARDDNEVDVVGIDAATGLLTLTAKPSALSYDDYVAIIDQSGTGQPTVIVLDALVGNTITWTRTGLGTYAGDVATNLTDDDSWCSVTTKSVGDAIYYELHVSSGDVVLSTFSGGGAADFNTRIYVSIRVY